MTETNDLTKEPSALTRLVSYICASVLDQSSNLYILPGALSATTM